MGTLRVRCVACSHEFAWSPRPAVVQLPTISEYRDAVSDPSHAFRDGSLRASRPFTDNLGMPKAVSGNFAAVFRLSNDAAPAYAVKCFTRAVENQQARYAAIAQALERLSVPWRVAFEHLPEGVLVRGQWFPVLKMEWIEGKGLLQYIDVHASERTRMLDLAQRFTAMTQDLAASNLAHGDLQHGNLIICPDGTLKLVDYDGMFVPGLELFGASDCGHRHYQPPSRRLSDYDATLDRFSSWVILWSLLAIAVDGDIWRAVRTEGVEAILLQEADYVDPERSTTLSVMRDGGQKLLTGIADQILKLVRTPPTAIPPLSESSLPTLAREILSNRIPSVSRIPPWIKGGSDQAEGGGGAAVWMESHLGAPLLRRFSDITPVIRWCVRLGIGLDVAASAGFLFLLSLARAEAPAVGTGVLALSATILATVVARYQRSPERREKRVRIRTLADKRRALATLTARVSELDIQLAGLGASEAKATEANEIRKRALAAEETRKLKEAGDRRTKAIVEAERQLSILTTEEIDERAKALSALREAHVAERLTQYDLWSASVPGLGDTLKPRLVAAGLRTAADFVGVSATTSYSGRYANTRASIRLRGGSTIFVDGIGPAKAEALDAWREKCRRIALHFAPSQLSGDASADIGRKYRASRDPHESKRQEADSLHSREVARVRDESTKTRMELEGELRDSRAQRERQRGNSKAARAEAERTMAGARWAAMQHEREATAYNGISFKRYLRELLFST
jgi:serine/threonine protein kinase